MEVKKQNCIDCGKKDIMSRYKDLCNNCYHKRYYYKSKDMIKEKYYQKKNIIRLKDLEPEDMDTIKFLLLRIKHNFIRPEDPFLLSHFYIKYAPPTYTGEFISHTIEYQMKYMIKHILKVYQKCSQKKK